MRDAYQHGTWPAGDRRADLRRAALNAEWQGAGTGPYAGVIRQLRHRGNEFNIRRKGSTAP